MVLYEVISKRSNVMEGTLMVDRLNNLLDELSKAGGKMCVTDFIAWWRLLLTRHYKRSTNDYIDHDIQQLYTSRTALDCTDHS
jgi:hypothetical protein